MSFETTLAFLKAVKENNNTTWLHTYRDLFQQEKTRFADFIQKVLDKLTELNRDFKELTPKDCIFRFNRDIRFSANKSPYKEHFGAVIAEGGRKSELPCLYIHIQPGNQSMIAGGLYLPPTEIFHKVRHHISKNLKQRNKIISNAEFKDVFGEVLGKVLVKIPKGYSSADKAAERFLYKSFYVDHMIKDKEVNSKDFLEKIVTYYKVLKPFNDFLE